jgi:hypothetical protein
MALEVFIYLIHVTRLKNATQFLQRGRMGPQTQKSSHT